MAKEAAVAASRGLKQFLSGLLSRAGEAADPRTASQQRLRLRRLGLSLSSYMLFAVVSIYLLESDQLALSRLQYLGVVVVTLFANLIFATLILTGRNLRFEDPSLTRGQIFFGLLFYFFMFWACQTIFSQDFYFFAFLQVLFFAAFRLDVKENVALALPVFVAIVAVTIIKREVVDETLFAASARGALYAALFGWTIFFVGFVSRLRRHLAESNHELRKAMRRIEEIAIRDDLTGAYNRRFITTVVEREAERARRTETPFSICMLDVDHFKQVNDQYGHPIGDSVLCEVVERINGSIRETDQIGHASDLNMVGRFGGEEFFLVLPVTPLEGARICAERVRDAMRSKAFETGSGEMSVTISGGIAEYQVGEDVEALIKRVDLALYKAKENGRDRIEAADVSVADPDVDASTQSDRVG